MVSARPLFRTTTIAGVLIVAACSWRCSSDAPSPAPPAPEGGTCKSDTHCQEGLECVVEGLTEYGWIDDACSEADPCSSALTCGPGARCIPAAPPPGKAGLDDRCTDKACMVGLVCTPEDVQYGWWDSACSDDFPCSSGFFCSDGICDVEPTLPGHVTFLDDCSELPCMEPFTCEGVAMPPDCFENPDGSVECSDPWTYWNCGGAEPDPDWTTHVCKGEQDAAEALGTCEVIKEPGNQVLGAPCLEDSDCISGLCLESEYGPPFCSRACEVVQEPCPDGPDAVQGDSFCISFDELPDVNAPVFKGEISTFCVRRCDLDVEECEALNPNWEVCAAPTYLGDPLYPNLGTNFRICQAPSYQGKDPVDPYACNWEKTINGFPNEANLCRKYCAYLLKCKEIPKDSQESCCEWGCFNQMVHEGEVNDPWYNEVKCFIDNHFAYPDVAQDNSCNQPPIQCDTAPLDPTPPAAERAGN